jgi:ADP-heptose:LPS heptosyltransferase
LKNNIQHIIISRTDAIGDVVLTLPLCGVLKNEHPNLKITFLGNTYTKPVVELSKNVDAFLNWDDVKNKSAKEQADFLKEVKADCILHVFPRKEIANAAKSAKIKLRIGTRSRLFHWFTCNQLVSLHRKNSDLHEAQLNILLAKNILQNTNFEVENLEQFYNCKQTEMYNHSVFQLIDKNKFNLILHPKSKGSAREWSLDKYLQLIEKLPASKFNIFITGNDAEKLLLNDWLKKLPNHVHDITGKFTLPQFISFINACDGLIAASTGPLHIASMLGKRAIGLYAPMRPIFPMRWKPIGKQADYLVMEKENCFDCKHKPSKCSCIQQIEVDEVKNKLMDTLENN